MGSRRATSLRHLGRAQESPGDQVGAGSGAMRIHQRDQHMLPRGDRALLFTRLLGATATTRRMLQAIWWMPDDLGPRQPMQRRNQHITKSKLVILFLIQ